MIEVQLTLFDEYTEAECYCCHFFWHVNDMVFYDIDGTMEVRSLCDICLSGVIKGKSK